MSKKNKRQQSNAPSEQMKAETRVVKRDLLQTVIINVIFIGIILGLYFWNESAGEPLSNWIKDVLGL